MGAELALQKLLCCPALECEAVRREMASSANAVVVVSRANRCGGL